MTISASNNKLTLKEGSVCDVILSTCRTVPCCCSLHFVPTCTRRLKVQYRHSIPAPVDRTSASALFYKHLLITCQKNKPSSSMTHVACESKLRLVLRSSLHPWPESFVESERTVLYYARDTQASSAGIKFRHWRSLRTHLNISKKKQLNLKKYWSTRPEH